MVGRSIFLVLMILATEGWAQQMTFWSLNAQDPYIYNPGYGGFDRSLSANFHYLNQWNDIADGVQGQLINAHLPLYIINGGVGIQAARDISGPLHMISGGLSYNYVLTTRFGLWSFGGRIGLQQVELRGRELITPDGDYGNGQVDHRDDDLPESSVSGVSQKIDLGIFYQLGDLQLGLALNNILPSDVSLSGNDYRFRMARMLQIFGRYDYEINDLVGIRGHLIVQSDLTQTQAQAGFQLAYQNNIFAGAAFRGYDSSSRDAIIFSAGIRINKHFNLFYAYDYAVSRLRSYTQNNTHEFTFSYNLNELIRTGLPPKVIYNPRF